MTNNNSENYPKNVDIISGRILLGLIGLIAFLLPVILFLASIIFDDCQEIQTTISAYYHTNSRDGMVGMICALSFAFFAYEGYSDDKSVFNDSLIGNLAAIFALGVAFFPTSVDASSCIQELDNKIFGIVHNVSAILLFLTLAFFCIFQFTKLDSNTYCFSNWNKLSDKKKSVNRFYIFCGILILICMLVSGIIMNLNDENSFKKSISTYKPIFWLETLMLWLFAAGWLRKSKFLGMYDNNKLE
ncbi:MAG: hypothetical protein IPM34_06910 [Saprospiraceae bacterium]|nr:hypothetical protein [Saprospiraceae bacterium]